MVDGQCRSSDDDVVVVVGGFHYLISDVTDCADTASERTAFFSDGTLQRLFDYHHVSSFKLVTTYY